MRVRKEEIIGKYLVTDTKDGRYKMFTDNPREAVWESNRYPNRIPVNLCGDREFYKDENGIWRSKPL